MRLIDQRYRKLKPSIDYLADEIVIAQAWKKTHTYMRTHNWYADTLALDISALGLEAYAKKWAADVEKKDYKPEAMELVPAPKSQKWVVDDNKGWIREDLLKAEKAGENKDEAKKPIRPLAHLTVKDQTLASAAMLCLADPIETEQGDNSEQDFIKAQQKGVYSYGNRLVCDWKGTDAWFRWGNNQTYRKYFTDYKLFLKRPVSIGHNIASNADEAERTYIISLDISSFYDQINRDVLIEKIKRILKISKKNAEVRFWTQFKKIIDWTWDGESKRRAKDIGLDLGEGIPQGLVSAGFFANAYLIDFDKAVGTKIGLSIPKSGGAILQDYCRYVDDIRLVVSMDEEITHERLKSSILQMFNEELSRHSHETLSFNEKKTKITSLVDLDSMGSLSVRVDQLQGELSGPVDRDIIDSALGILEGFITIESDNIPDKYDDLPDNSLLKLAKFDHDIRPDTLKRFAANRLEILMRNKRRIGDNSQDQDNPKAIESIDNESELLAKKLIWAWMCDPSLSLVLRKAFEIFPDSRIGEPVFEALIERCYFNNFDQDISSSIAAEYTIADLFRACIDFYGYFQRIEYPKSSDPKGLFSCACQYAQKVLSFNYVPNFIQRQALLLLAVFEKPVEIVGSKPMIQHVLHKILAGNSFTWSNQNLALFEVASQITGDPSTISRQLLTSIEGVSESTSISAVEELAKRGGEFWNQTWHRIKKAKPELLKNFKWATPVTSTTVKISKQHLSKIISSESNGFIHEAALLKLALKLIEQVEIDHNIVGASPAQLFIAPDDSKDKVDGWEVIWKEGIKLQSIRRDKKKSFKDPRYDPPYWISTENDAREIYWIAMILRAAVIGQNDFTSYRWKSSRTIGYKGLRTGWYKRRMGMMHAPEALVGEYATLSSWSADLLMTCLQWPGFESTHVQNDSIAKIDDLGSFKTAIKEQLKHLNDIQCKFSDIPTIITKVKRPESSSEGKFRLVTIQQILPRSEDFSVADPTMGNVKTKQINREHLSKVCQLAYRTLCVTRNSDSAPAADLIVFPEVAIHPDDQDVVKRLADKTRSMVFAGLIFVENNGQYINNARWFIPSYQESGRQWIIRDQGKAHPTSVEKKYGVVSNRPCQHIIEVKKKNSTENPFKLSGAICYDATDLKLAADLKGKTDLFVVVAHNKDVTTFDAMAVALHYHMYQHVVVVNKGQYGGSTIQAPYKESFDRLISHSHGTDQISINVADLDLAAFRRKAKKYKEVKTPPAGI